MRNEPAPSNFRDFVRCPTTLSAAVRFLVFWRISLIPSLLQRAWLAQGIVSALSATSGYLIGAAIGWGLRQFRPWADWWRPDRHRRARRAIAMIAPVATAVGLILWCRGRTTTETW